MTAEQILHLIPYAVSAGISLGIGWYAWQHRNITGAVSFGWLTIGQALTTAAYIAELGSNDLDAKIFWDDVQWVTLTHITIAMLVFALDYTNRLPKYPRRAWLLLLIFPMIFWLLVMTNPFHQLTRADVALIPGEIFSNLTYPFTTMTSIFSGYLTVLVFSAIGLVARHVLEVGAPYRAQVITVLLGIGTPAIISVLMTLAVYLSNQNTIVSDQRVITPLAFVIGDVIVAWGLLRYRLFEIAPIARAAVFESLNDAILVLDNQNRIVDLNPAAETLIARFSTQNKVVGLAVEQVFPYWASNFQTFTGQETTYQTELTVKGVTTGTDTGQIKDELIFFASISPIKTRTDFVTGHVVLLKDITDRKSTEAQLIQRTHELERARSLAESADQHKTQFVATVSHELRTPLNAIINFNQFVATGLFGDVNPRQVDALEKSTAGARYLLELINDLLDLSKIEAGHIILEVQEDVDLMADIEEAITVSRGLIGKKQVSIIVETEDNLPCITVDRRRFRQILLNLMSNAIKFTPTGHVRVYVRGTSPTSQQSSENSGIIDEIVFAVEDTGLGIPPEHHTMIFEPFRQLQRDSGRIGSTGLGLPLTRRLVEAHGGRMWLESKVGVGSTFYFSLPCSSPLSSGGFSGTPATPDKKTDVTMETNDLASPLDSFHTDHTTRDIL